MSSTVVGMILGGILIMSLSAGSTLLIENRKPMPKALVRDFIVGGVLVAMIMQLLPESSEAVLSSIATLIPTAAAFSLPSMPSMSGGSAALDDMEVRVGVPQF